MKRYVVGLLVLALVAWFAAPSIAAVVTVDYQGSGGSGDSYVFTRTTGAPNWSGGPFTMNFWDTSAGALDPTKNFNTFCVEKNEFVTLDNSLPINSPKYVAAGLGVAVDSASEGVQSIFSKKNLTVYGAWLYAQYRTGSTTLQNWVNSTGAQAMQNAIWWSMVADPNDPYGVGGTKTDNELGVSKNTWLAGYGGYDTALDAQGLGYNDFLLTGIVKVTGVVVVNIMVPGYIGPDDQTHKVQDMLGLTEEPGSFVPEPASMLVWSLLGGAGLGLAGIRRRRRA